MAWSFQLRWSFPVPATVMATCEHVSCNHEKYSAYFSLGLVVTTTAPAAAKAVRSRACNLRGSLARATPRYPFRAPCSSYTMIHSDMRSEGVSLSWVQTLRPRLCGSPFHPKPKDPTPRSPKLVIRTLRTCKAEAHGHPSNALSQLGQARY